MIDPRRRCPICGNWYKPGEHPPEFVDAGLVTMHDIGARWGVTRERVRRLAMCPDFPAPVDPRRPRRWALADIDAFAPHRFTPADQRQKPGPKPKKKENR